MQKHSNSGGHNTFNMVCQKLRLLIQQFINAKFGSWNYPGVLVTLQVTICRGLLVFFVWELVNP
jgi:hypothetical protein